MIEAFSPFFINREEDEVPSHIILKGSGDKNCPQLLHYYQKNDNEESVHYLLDVMGTLYQIVDTDFNIKNSTPGNITIAVVEMINEGDNAVQLQKLQELLCELCINYSIPLNRIQTTEDYRLPMFDFLASLGSIIMQQLVSVPVAEDEDEDC